MTTAWQDRRGMFQKGKELHEPSSPSARRFSETGVTNSVRRASTSSAGSPIDKTTSNTSASGTSGRRRSSAASNGALFNNLTNMKRGSEDYHERRASHLEMHNQGGLVSGWFNKTFRGVQQPQAGGTAQQGGNDKRGVME